jgi:hypothetical protein
MQFNDDDVSCGNQIQTGNGASWCVNGNELSLSANGGNQIQQIGNGPSWCVNGNDLSLSANGNDISWCANENESSIRVSSNANGNETWSSESCVSDGQLPRTAGDDRCLSEQIGGDGCVVGKAARETV